MGTSDWWPEIKNLSELCHHTPRQSRCGKAMTEDTSEHYHVLKHGLQCTKTGPLITRTSLYLLPDGYYFPLLEIGKSEGVHMHKRLVYSPSVFSG